MDIWHIFGLSGGLALFLHGMNLMSEGLELAAGSKIQTILAKLTSNKFLGVFFGMVLTAIIQSSSATTVMVVGFVNSQLMNLNQAINVIMGANIGTTVTGLIIALDVTRFAPLIAFTGILLHFLGISKLKYWARAIMGLGFLFMGLNMMSESMVPLRESTTFLHFIQTLSSPLLAICFGMVFTAIIQSSSASVGILQTLARQGLVPFSISFYVVLGQNIGTCITSVLASAGTSRNSKRAALSHVLFNLTGVLVFFVLSYMLPIASWIQNLAPGEPASQIAFFHLLFNLTTTLLWLPFTHYLARFVQLLIPVRENEMGRKKSLLYVKSDTFQDNMVAIKNIEMELYRLLKMVAGTVDASLQLFVQFDEGKKEEIEDAIDTIRTLDRDLNGITVKMISRKINKIQSQILINDLKILSHMERMADYLQRLSQLAENNEINDLAFSHYAKNEILCLDGELKQMGRLLLEGPSGNFREQEEEAFDRKIHQMITNYEGRHLDRLSEGVCTAASGMQYSGLLSSVERISYHMERIGRSLDQNRSIAD